MGLRTCEELINLCFRSTAAVRMRLWKVRVNARSLERFERKGNGMGAGRFFKRLRSTGTSISTCCKHCKGSCKHFKPTLMISNAIPLFTPTDHFTCRSKCRFLSMKLLKKIPFKQTCDFSDKIRRLWRANRDFSGVQGPSRYAVCVDQLLLLLREIPRG